MEKDGAPRRVLVITGYTASGKSALSLELAGHIPLEVISADSMQVYRGMDIGTDKVSAEERAEVRHHLIDIKDPDEAWSVEEFVSRAGTAIDLISDRGSLPCVVGGTGLYVRALLEGFPLVDGPPNPELRRELMDMARERGNEAVHACLRDKDPKSWQILHPNDLRRVIRALEYFHATSRPISERLEQKQPKPYKSFIIGIAWDRHVLEERIDNRVEMQFQRGFVEEVRSLIAKGYCEDLPSMQGLGYKEVCLFLRGLLTLEEAKNLIKRNSRRFLKRQFTWFSRERGINWVSAGNDIGWASTVNSARKLCISWLNN